MNERHSDPKRTAPGCSGRRLPLARAARLVLATALFAISIAPFAAKADSVMTPWTKPTPPPFELPGLGDDPVALAERRGQVVMLNFWATWCGPCIEELPSLDRLAAALADEPFELIAVNMGDSREALVAFLDRLGLDPGFTIALDVDGDVTRDWDLFAYPTTVLLDAEGGAVSVRHGATEWDAPEVIELVRSLMPGAPRTEVPTASEPSASTTEIRRVAAALDGPVATPAVPARPGSREPNLVVDSEGAVRLSWLEPAGGERFALRLSRLADGAWSEPVTIASGDDWFVNWADFPSVAALDDGALAAWWPVTNGDDPYAYDLHLSLSVDGGERWSEPVVPHRDGTPTQHGMTSLLAWPDGGLFATWLDGRVNAGDAGQTASGPLPGDRMTLRSARVDADGTVSDRTLLDPHVCTCCPTDAVRSGDAVLVAYRDRTVDEVRDISILRHENGTWSEPAPVHRDGWRIAGCPVNGPALAADGQAVVATWFTAADDTPRALLARSSDGGHRFGDPVRVDEGRALGRLDTVLLDDGTALVSALERTDLGEALRVRAVPVQGSPGPALTLASTTGGRTVGFPKMVRSGDEVIVAWTLMGLGGPVGVQTAVLRP